MPTPRASWSACAPTGGSRYRTTRWGASSCRMPSSPRGGRPSRRSRSGLVARSTYHTPRCVCVARREAPTCAMSPRCSSARPGSRTAAACSWKRCMPRTSITRDTPSSAALVPPSRARHAAPTRALTCSPSFQGPTLRRGELLVRCFSCAEVQPTVGLDGASGSAAGGAWWAEGLATRVMPELCCELSLPQAASCGGLLCHPPT